MSNKAGKPALKLVSTFSDKTYRYKHSVQIASDLDPDAHLDVAFISALRLYVHEKAKELGIEDYRVFIEDDQMDIYFLCPDDRQNFEAAYEDRVNHEIRIMLDIPGKTLKFQLQNIIRELHSLARQFGVDEDVLFDIADGGIEMTALNRDAFVTFFQEYAHVKDRIPFYRLADPHNAPLLVP